MLCSCIIRQCAGVSRLVSVRRASILSTDKLDATVEENTGVCRLVMKNAPVNAMEKDFLSDMRDVAVEADKSPNISSLVLSSALPHTFSAGLDLQELVNVDQDEQRFREYWSSLQELLLTLYIMRGVSVAAIDGHCIAGGLVVALAADYRISSMGKHMIGLNETKLGVHVPIMGIEMFKNQVGLRESMSALPYAQLYDVTSAHRVGLVEEVCAPGEIDQAVQSFLNAVISIPSQARFTTKLHLRQQSFSYMRSMQEVDMENVVAVFKKPETKNRLLDYIMSLSKRPGKENKR